MIAATPGTPLALTPGEPAGIGPDLCIAIAKTPLTASVVVIGDPDALAARADRLGEAVDILPVPGDQAFGAVNAGQLRVLCEPLQDPEVCGVPSRANAPALLGALRTAVEGCLTGRFRGLVTGPLQKSIINEAGTPFSGHTEYLAELTGTPLPVMLLVGGGLKVALATTHLPLSRVPVSISTEHLERVLRILRHDLEGRFGLADPEIVVLGLNPHAGEGGHLGHEDLAVIRPAIETLRGEGLNVRGPVPADTAFTPAGGHADAVLAMYHDQGLPVLKFASFGSAVNVTLGLPIVRTSVDHGTALDLAGSGTADAGSLLAAIELAERLSAQ